MRCFMFNKYKIGFRKLCYFLIIYMFGIISVIVFQYGKTLFPFHQYILAKGEVGDVAIERIGDPNSEAICIFKGEYPVLKLWLNKISKHINRISLLDGDERILGQFYLTNERLSGVEILNNDASPTFQMKYLEDEKKWGMATYSRPFGESFIGEFYCDLNCDGNFDLFLKYDKYGSYSHSCLYFNHQWNPIVTLAKNWCKAQVVLADEKREKLDMIFDFKEGWIPDELNKKEN